MTIKTKEGNSMERKKSPDENSVTLTGTLASPLRKAFNPYGAQCYEGLFDVARLSGNIDRIRVMFPRSLAPHDHTLLKGNRYGIRGAVCARYRREETPGGESVTRTHFYVNAEDVRPAPEAEEDGNEICLTGTLKYDPLLRVTPLYRELHPDRGENLAELMLRVRNEYGSILIPCISFYETARYAALELGQDDPVRVTGRFQSRDFLKRYANGKEETRTVNEVAVRTFERLENSCTGEI